MTMRRIIWVIPWLVLLACTGGGTTVDQGETALPDMDVPRPPETVDGRASTDGRPPEDFFRDWGEVFPREISPEEVLTEGGFGWPCTENDDCLSGFCVMHLGGLVCTQVCVEECPEGWDCLLYSGFGDPMHLCISALANLCRPCAADGDCDAEGTDDACVDYGAQGAFCGGSCETDGDCPAGYHCAEATTVAGIASQECLADEGMCECTQASIDSGDWTYCEAANQWGECGGKRVCTEEGLAPCDAPAPEAEVCNGADDDCDGATDEETCDDDNLCTIDSCDASVGCVFEPVDDGTECPLPDNCAAQASCQEGECVGVPVECPSDYSPCTNDVCVPGVGCVNQFPDETFDCTGHPGLNCEELDNNDVCDGIWECIGCVCTPSAPVLCPLPEGKDAPCRLAVCDPQTGECDLVANTDQNGFACNLDDQCVAGQTCQDGVCQGGVEINCQDGIACTVDTCEPEAGCLHTPSDELCDDGLPCTMDLCDGVLGCVPGPDDLACDDGNVCTEDSCLAGIGCQHDAVEDGLACDDSNLCTEPDMCQAGICLGEPSDVLCLESCPEAGLHGCIGGGACVCMWGSTLVTGAPSGPQGCLAKSASACLTVDSVDGVAAPGGTLTSQSGTRVIEPLSIY